MIYRICSFTLAAATILAVAGLLVPRPMFVAVGALFGSLALAIAGAEYMSRKRRQASRGRA